MTRSAQVPGVSDVGASRRRSRRWEAGGGIDTAPTLPTTVNRCPAGQNPVDSPTMTAELYPLPLPALADRLVRELDAGGNDEAKDLG